MDGLILLNKEQNITSQGAVNRIKRLFGASKAGHTGTLDPMATGVLPCLVGTAARLCDVMPDETKTYRAAVKFGIVTDTQDITGAVLSESDMPVTKEALSPHARPLCPLGRGRRDADR